MAVTVLVDPIKSPKDHRLYRRLKLDNQLDVLLISDPEIQRNSADDDDLCGDSGADEEQADSESGSDDGSQDDYLDDSQQTHVKKAAAAMAVGVGSFTDPDDVPGMSHYLEHMLFMGSEQFPDENDYDSYLQSNGGSANAFTELEFTNYHFDCKPDALHGALQRFSQFFVAPLCKADALEREVNAVDNEFSGVQQDDGMRLSQLRCHTSRDKHVYRKFTWGNKKSLVTLTAEKGIDVRSELVQYYRQHYGAERMSLAVIGGEPLDFLQQWVVDLFAAVPPRGAPRPTFSHAGFPYEGGRLYVVPAVKKGHHLTVTFQLPSLFSAYREKAEDYISHLVGHEGSGSLLSALKAAGWASAISAGVNESGYERNTALFVFEVSITLTDAGLAAAPGCGLATVGPLFAYLGMLRAAGPQRWVFQELADIAALKFRFAEEEDACEYVSRLAADMPLYAPEHALCGAHLYEHWDPALVSDLLERMTPASCRIDLQTDSFKELVKQQALASQPGAVSDVEPWFELPYVCLPVAPELLRSWEQPGEAVSKGLALPPRNHYIPTDFTLVSAGGSGNGDGRAKAAATALLQGIAQPVHENGADSNGTAQRTVTPLVEPPLLIADAPGLQVWHNMDTTFETPKAVAYLAITTAAAYASARAAAATHLILKLLEDALCETAYLADVAGLSYDVWPEGLNGIEIKVEGFSHKLPLLTTSVVQQLVSLKVDAHSFERVKEGLVRKYANCNMAPEKHASYLRLRALKHLWHLDETLRELEALTPAHTQSFLPQLLRNSHITALLQGNLTVDDAMSIAGSVRAALSDGIMTAAERPLDRVTRLPNATLLHRAPVKNSEEDNSVAEVYCMAGPNEVALRAKLDLLEQILAEPFYDTLRTKEQLGYSVHCSTRLTHGILGFAFVVISGGHGPAHLDARIDAFLDGYISSLASMSEDELEGHRQSLIAAKMQKDHTLAEEADRNWEQISSRRYDFLAREEEVAALEHLTLEALQEAYSRYFAPRSASRCKLAVHIVGKSCAQELQMAAPEGVRIVSDPAAIKHELGTFPAIEGELPSLAA